MLDVAFCYLVIASRNQLLEHYQRFLRGWVQIRIALLTLGSVIQVLILVLEQRFRRYFQDEISRSFLSLGSYSLHPFIASLEKHLRQCCLILTISSIIQKLSSVSKENYASLESLANVSAVYAMKHTETRSYSLKIVCVRFPKQWKHLKRVFFKVLTKEEIFKQRIALASRYQGIKAGVSK